MLGSPNAETAGSYPLPEGSWESTSLLFRGSVRKQQDRTPQWNKTDDGAPNCWAVLWNRPPPLPSSRREYTYFPGHPREGTEIVCRRGSRQDKSPEPRMFYWNLGQSGTLHEKAGLKTQDSWIPHHSLLPTKKGRRSGQFGRIAPA